MPQNIIKCCYCSYTTPRFFGNKRGEWSLRFHVQTEHRPEYLAGIGLTETDDDDMHLWGLDDEAPQGEQAL